MHDNPLVPHEPRQPSSPSAPSSSVRSLLAPANRERLVAEASELIAFGSIGGSDAEASINQHLARRWKESGWDVHEWDIDLADVTGQPDFPGMEVHRTKSVGVLARIPGTGGGRTLLLNGHTDVVPPGDIDAWEHDPFDPRVVDVDGRERLIGRGACDMKAGLAAALEAVRIVQESGVSLRGDVLIAPVSGEEDGGLGTYALLHEMRARGIQADACVVPEPTDLDLVPANGGALTFRLRVRGAAVHASRRTEGVNAIEKFFPVMQALAELEKARNADVDPLMDRWPVAYPLSIGTVTAGDWASTVPDLLVAEGRYGVALGESVTSARAALESAVAAACESDAWLRDHPVVVEWWGGQFASGRTDPDSAIVGLTATAHEAATGQQPATYGGPYGSDLRLLTGIGSIPTVQYGPGDSAVAHSPNEYVLVDDVVTCSEVLAQVIVDFCS